MTGTPSLNGGHGSSGAGRLVSVPVLTAALRRRWRLWVGGAVAGAAAALVFSVVYPPEHTATTLLFLAHPSQIDPAKAMVTDAQLVESRAVARAAIDDLGLRMSPQQLVDQYEPTILSSDLLEIKVEGPSDREAVRRAEGVANSFLAFRRNEVQRQSKVAIENLEERQRALNAELLTVNEGIHARAGALSEDEQLALADLLVQRAGLNDRLSTVRQRIETATFDTDSVSERSDVADPAGADERSPLEAAAVNVLAGIILGLLATTGWIVVQEATTDRLRRREDVAAALGASVGASIGRIRGPMLLQRRRFRRLLANPTPDLARAVEHLRGALDRTPAGKRALVLVSLDSDATAAAALGSMTLQLMREGRRVLVVDLTRRNVLARLTKIQPDAPDRLPLVGNASALWVSSPPDEMPEVEESEGPDLYKKLSARVDTVLALATVDPLIGANHLSDVARTAVVMATAGRSSEVGLRSVAQMIESAGLRVHSALLAGADANDESAGLLAPLAPRPNGVAPRVVVSP